MINLNKLYFQTWPYIFQQVPELSKKKPAPSHKNCETSTNYSHIQSKPMYEQQPVYVPAITNRNTYPHHLNSNDLVMLYN
jgi:hypothetical protein